MWTKADIKRFLRTDGKIILSFEPYFGELPLEAETGEGYRYIYAGQFTTGSPGGGVNSDYPKLTLSSIENISSNTSDLNYTAFGIVNYIVDGGSSFVGYKIKIFDEA